MLPPEERIALRDQLTRLSTAVTNPNHEIIQRINSPSRRPPFQSLASHLTTASDFIDEAGDSSFTALPTSPLLDFLLNTADRGRQELRRDNRAEHAR